MTRKKEIISVSILVIITLFVRLLISASSIHTPDSALYMKLAGAIKQGQLVLDIPQHVHSILQPGYSLVVFVFDLALNNIALAGLIISLVSGLALTVVVYFLGKKLFNYQTGLLAGIIIAIHPYFIFYSTSILTESLFTLLIVIIIYLFWVILTRLKSSYWYLLLGILIGSVYLIRVAGLFLIGTILLWLISQYFYQKRENFKKVFLNLLFLFIGTALIIAPFFLFLYQQRGTFIITGAQYYYTTPLSEYDPDMNISEQDFQRYSINNLNDDKTDYQANTVSSQELTDTQSPFGLLRNYFKGLIGNLSHNLKFFIITFFVQIIWIVYSFYKYRRDRKKLFNCWYLLSWGIFIILIYLMGRPILRYYFPIIPLFLILMSAGIILFTKKVSSKELRFFIIAMLVGFLLVYEILLNGIPQYITLSRYSNFFIKPLTLFQLSDDPEKVLGGWIKENLGNDLKILSPLPIVSYYAGATHYPIPFADYESILYFARHNKINYIILLRGNNYISVIGLDFLFNLSKNKDFLLVSQQKNVFIYKIKDISINNNENQ